MNETACAPPAPGFTRSHRAFLWIYSIVAGSLLLRFTLFDFASGDYELFLSKWYDYLVEHGRWNGLGTIGNEVSSYPPLYLYCLSLSTLLPVPKLYAIKLISVAADYVAAWYVWRLARRECPGGSRPALGIAVFLFLPTVVMNGALWGQCDVMYTAGFLASLFYLLERRPLAMLVAFGFSASLKPQAIFWCPLLAGLFVTGRLPWKLLWAPAAVYAACGLPAVLAGAPPWQVLLHWARVENTPGLLALGATNWYQWVIEQHPEVFWLPGVALTLAATAFLVLWMVDGIRPGQSESGWLVSLALLSVLFPPFLLPGMHERYFFAADVLAVIYALYVARGWRVALLVQFASAFTCLPYLFGREPVPRWLLALVMLAAIALAAAGLARRFGRPVGDSGAERPEQ